MSFFDFLYSIQKIKQGQKLIKEQGLSIRQAAKQVGIPYSKLQRKQNSKDLNDSRKKLTSNQESSLAKHIIDWSGKGFPRTPDDIKNDAHHIIKTFNDKNAKRPGKCWLKGFLKRHPELSVRKTEFISKAHSKLSAGNLKQWHEYVKNYLQENNLHHLLERPSIIGNCDETGVVLGDTTRKHVGLKSQKARYVIQNGNIKENVTVLFTGMADGTLLKPFVIFKGVRLSPNLVSNIPEGIDYAITKSGWMEKDAMIEYIQHSFVPQLQALNREPPYVFFTDGHRSYISIEISELCENCRKY